MNLRHTVADQESGTFFDYRSPFTFSS